jgi:hypothetical protein
MSKHVALDADLALGVRLQDKHSGSSSSTATQPRQQACTACAGAELFCYVCPATAWALVRCACQRPHVGAAPWYGCMLGCVALCCVRGKVLRCTIRCRNQWRAAPCPGAKQVSYNDVCQNKTAVHIAIVQRAAATGRSQGVSNACWPQGLQHVREPKSCLQWLCNGVHLGVSAI